MESAGSIPASETPNDGNQQIENKNMSTRKFRKGDLVAFKPEFAPNVSSGVFKDNPQYRFRLDRDEDGDGDIRLPDEISAGVGLYHRSTTVYMIEPASETRTFKAGDIVRFRPEVKVQTESGGHATLDELPILTQGHIFLVFEDQGCTGNVKLLTLNNGDYHYIGSKCLELVSSVDDPMDKRKRDCLAARLLDVQTEIAKLGGIDSAKTDQVPF